MVNGIPFSFILNHLMVIPVTVNGEKRKFLFDTGIGVTVITKKFAEYLKLEPNGIFSGKRMSGQNLSMPLTALKTLKVGSVERGDFPVCIFDTSAFPSELKEISGILSPNFFEDVIFSMNYEKNEIQIREKQDRLERLCHYVIPVDVERAGPSVTIFVNALLPSSRRVRLELDSGSDALILNSKFMDEIGTDRKASQIDSSSCVDETGNEYVRYFTTLRGKISMAGSEEIYQVDPRVIFQEIIYDGLLGNDFLKNYNVSFDLKLGKIGFNSFKK
jgi:hypothetical protein